MKIIAILFIAAGFFCSCNEQVKKNADSTAAVTIPEPVKKDSATIKLEWAIDKIARADLQQGGYKLLSLEIDSLTYQHVSIKDFYNFRKAAIETEREKYKEINRKLKQDGIAINQSKLLDDSLKSARAIETLVQLSQKADTTSNIYCVTYKLVAKTNTTTYNNQVYTKYIYAKDFSEVRMKF